MAVLELKRVKLDEIELALGLLKKDNPKLINDSTSKEIAQMIQNNFGYICREQDIFLLHEPTIEDDVLGMEIHYRMLGLI